MALATRKYLAPFDPTRPDSQISGFVVPDRSGKFLSISSGKLFEAGLIVYVGTTITADTVYEKAARLGRNVNREDVERVIGLIADFKIGDVVAITTEPTFGLVKLKLERSRPSKLPK